MHGPRRFNHLVEIYIVELMYHLALIVFDYPQAEGPISTHVYSALASVNADALTLNTSQETVRVTDMDSTQSKQGS